MLRRVTAATMNEVVRGRTHTIHSRGTVGVLSNGDDGAEREHVQVRRSKFNFVDLAGSERQNERKLRASGEEESTSTRDFGTGQRDFCSLRIPRADNLCSVSRFKLTRLLKVSLAITRHS
jgi:hypothetical protein